MDHLEHTKVEGKVCEWAYSESSGWIKLSVTYYHGFLSMKWLGKVYSSFDGVIPSIKLAGTHLYTWLRRVTMRVKCLDQEHNAVPWPGLEPGALDLESITLSHVALAPLHLITVRIIITYLPSIWEKRRYFTYCRTAPETITKDW